MKTTNEYKQEIELLQEHIDNLIADISSSIIASKQPERVTQLSAAKNALVSARNAIALNCGEIYASPMYVYNRYGRELDYEAAVYKMDDDIREKLADELAPCAEQEFFDAYCEAHKEEYGEEWFLDNPNPNW